MRTTRALLLKYYHDSRYTFRDIVVCYRNRGAPGDQSCITGDRILHLDSYYMELSSEIGTTAIPYHRILQIRYHDRIIWEHGHLQDNPADGDDREEKCG